MLHLAPLSPLFPYTTLFRSEASVVGELDEVHVLRVLIANRDGDARAAAGARAEHHPDFQAQVSPTGAPRRRPARGAGAGARRDRKSTRLNSSHRCISYAVFC